LVILMQGLSEVCRDLIVVFIVLAALSAFTMARQPLGLFRALLLAVICLVLYVAFLNLTAGFPQARASFAVESEVKLIWLLVVVFVSVVFGTLAEYLFGLGESPFSLRKMLTPLCVSPLVMLPLIGSLPNVDQIATLQWVSLSFLGFQNGFFWRRVFEKASA
jgi:hypothetical protein